MDTKNQTWNVKKILEYALEKYHLLDDSDEHGMEDRSAYDKKIRRTMDNNKMVQKTVTGKSVYALPVDSAKYLVDVILKEYFEKHIDKAKRSKDFVEKDKRINEEERIGDEEYFSKAEVPQHEFFDNPGIPMNPHEIDGSINRMMLRAVFDLFYDFEEESYRNDYIERKNHMNIYSNKKTSDVVKEGFSELDEKIANPLKHYCNKREVFFMIDEKKSYQAHK